MLVRKLAASTLAHQMASEAVRPVRRTALARHFAISTGVSRSILAAMIVMGAAMLTAAPAMAGTCTVTAPIVCSGAASTTDTDTAITVNLQAPVVVALPVGFGYDNTGLANTSRGITLIGQGVTFTDQAETQIRAGYEALRIQNNGGTANVTVNGSLEATSRRPDSNTYAFEFRTDASAGDANISLNNVVGLYQAVLADQTGPGDLNLTINNATSTLDNVAGRFIAAGNANVAEVTRLSNLERVVNRGLISLADGGADDVLIVGGDISFAAGSVLAVDINGAADADLLSASGTVELNGVTLQVTDLGARPVLGRRYTIVDAGALAGEFSLTDSHLTNFLALSAFYTDKTAGLELVQRRQMEDAGLTDNQKEVGRELDRLSDGEGSRLWGKGLWNQGTSDGDRGTAKTKREAWGVLAGADFALGENLLLGISGAYLDNDVNQRSLSSEGSVKSIHVLGYVGAQAGHCA
jgi:uncharacterized protein with beta-barrel porin domain